MNKRRGLSLLTVLVMVFSLFTAWTVTDALAEEETAKGLKITGPKVVAKGLSIQLKANQKVTWSSSNARIASVSADGKVTGVSAGKATITATSKSNKNEKKNWTVTVKADRVKKVTIKASKTELAVGGTLKLKASASPSSAAQSFTWKSSKTSVVKVSSKGKVTAVAPGTAKITATAADGSKAEASITITVTGGGSTKYYALIIGNGLGYWENTLYGPPNDVKAVKALLKSTNQDWKITVKENVTSTGFRSAIQSAYAGATENDVCLFYYSGHGMDNTGDDSMEGALVGVDYYAFKPGQLANALYENAPGKVIVLLDSCGSGGLVYSKNGEKKEIVSDKKSAKKFVDAVISSFSYFDQKAKNAANTGEMLNGKFQVLAACAYRESCLDLTYEFVRGGAYTISLTRAGGIRHSTCKDLGYMPGDTSGDGQLTLQEAYKSVKSFVEENWWDQETQMYGDKNFVLFAR